MHSIGEVVLVRKNIYYKNMLLSIQHIQNLVMFKSATPVKVNISTSLRRSALEWYTSKLIEFNCDLLNNDPDIKS